MVNVFKYKPDDTYRQEYHPNIKDAEIPYIKMRYIGFN